MKRLILIPTYNEKENVPKLYQELRALNLDFDILFVDDNSPDGTGQIIRDLAAKDPGVFSLHREGKSGVGSAHKAGIYWAYERGYDELISMDCDFTHPPKAIFEILKFSGKVDVAVASRYMIDNSLEEWNPFRKFLTNFGHLMTKYLLGIPFDATGGFRLYDLKKVPKEIFQMVESNGYSFFFESLFVLHKNHFCIGEFPICLPARTYGHSKMTINEIFSSVKRLVQLSQIVYLHTDKYKFSHSLDRRDLDPSLVDVQNWDQYWNTEKSMGGPVYDLIARFYRRFIIRPNLNRFVRRHFAQGAHVLHAGCGSGQVDQDIRNAVDITGLDISVNALWQYKRHNGNLCGVLHGSIFNLPLAENSI
ncbi:MAG: glycosyltransferase, partial [Pseudobdellovibrionaceae bacterium]